MDLTLQHKIVKGEIDVNNQELFIRTLFRALVYNLNNQITCRDKKIPHFVLNTGDDIMYLEKKGQNASIEPKEVGGVNPAIRSNNKLNLKKFPMKIIYTIQYQDVF